MRIKHFSFRVLVFLWTLNILGISSGLIFKNSEKLVKSEDHRVQQAPYMAD